MVMTHKELYIGAAMNKDMKFLIRWTEHYHVFLCCINIFLYVMYNFICLIICIYDI